MKKLIGLVIVPLCVLDDQKQLTPNPPKKLIGNCDRCGRPFEAWERHCPCGYNLWAQRAGS